MEKSERYARGLELVKEMLGEERAKAIAERAKLYPDWDVYTKEFLFGEIWQRPGLDRRTRSLITVAGLTALGKEVELGVHVRGALNNGASKDEIVEVLMHMAFYAGWPATVSALRVATEIFREFGLLPPAE
jgi:4-carboxymuconolactone decarboxylase